MFSFIGWIWSQFKGPYWATNDSYKNAQGQGFLQRYVKNFEQELDNNIYPFISQVLDFFNALKANPAYLQYLAWNAGNPPLTGIVPTDQKIVAWAASLYKLKGTSGGFEAILNLFGFELVSIVEHWPPSTSEYDVISYDSGAIYDQGCPPCVTYDIVYRFGGQACTMVASPPIPNYVLPLLCMVQPIDVKLGQLIYTLGICDTYTPILNEVLVEGTPGAFLGFQVVLYPGKFSLGGSYLSPPTTGFYKINYVANPGFVNLYSIVSTPTNSTGQSATEYQSIGKTSLLASGSWATSFARGSGVLNESMLISFSHGAGYELEDIPWTASNGNEIVISNGILAGYPAAPNYSIQFWDVPGNSTIYCPVITFVQDTNTIKDNLIAQLGVTLRSATSSSVTIMIQRSHVSPTDTDFHVLMSWTDATFSGTPDPLDPTNPDKTMLTLGPGTYTLGVQTVYQYLGGLPVLGVSMIQEVIQVS